MNVFAELLHEASSPETHKLSSVLLKAKVFAYNVKGRKFRGWVNDEINGYPIGVPVPSYRVVAPLIVGTFDGPGGARLTNEPLSLLTKDWEFKKIFEASDIRNSVANLEDAVHTQDPWGDHIPSQILLHMRDYVTSFRGMKLNSAMSLIDRGSLVSILNCVRAQMLDFLLELGDKFPDLRKNDRAAENESGEKIDELTIRMIFSGPNRNP